MFVTLPAKIGAQERPAWVVPSEVEYMYQIERAGSNPQTYVGLKSGAAITVCLSATDINDILNGVEGT